MQPGYLLRSQYSIQQPLASGYFGDTYLAIDLDYHPQRYVIVKHLKPESQDPALLQLARRLFATEAMVLGRLGEITNRIPALYAYFEEQNEFYLVQEFIEGKTLSQELAAGKLSTLATIEILREILIGLSFVHAESTIHRDLKPDNIIRRSSDSSLVLIDFGAVKEVRKTTLTTPNPKTLASIGFGTEGYMPSEQAMGFPKLASDIYAVGAIGIECLTGKEPHQLFDEELLEFKWRHLYLASDPKIDPLISRLAMVLNKMLQQRHHDRYANAAEALAAIDRLLLFQSSPQLSSIILNKGLPTRIDRTAFLKLLGLGGLGVVGSLFVPQIVEKFDRQSTRIKSSRLKSINQRQFVEFVAPKLNERGDIIDRRQLESEMFDEDLGDDISLTMLKIPAGNFMMGSPEQEEGREIYEQPEHLVNIPEFYLGQTQITQAQWGAVFQDKSMMFGKHRQLPIDRINWFDAIAFCQRLSQKTGHKYRLPSESEWEYACRARTTTPFGHGDTIVPAIANYNGDYPYAKAPRGGYLEKTTPVGTFSPNQFGLYDMHGNLWEWCLDEWFDDYFNAPTDGSFRGSLDGSSNSDLLRVVRGGSWSSHARLCRSASRMSLFASFRDPHYGMRVVLVRE
jgi:eukaryotic-like serine/threonine-protein kinase